MTELDARMPLGPAYRRDPLGAIDRFDGDQRLDGPYSEDVPRIFSVLERAIVQRSTGGR